MANDPAPQNGTEIDGVEHVRVCNIRPGDILCDALGRAIGTVTVTAHPSPVDYDKISEFTLKEPGGGQRQDFESPSGVRVWRKFRP